HGVTFMPAVNWVERGLQGAGNALPRYHIVWGTSQRLTRVMIDAMRAADKGGRLTVLHRHRAVSLDHTAGAVSGVVAVNEETGAEIRIAAPLTVLAMGGINGSHE
ncbi:FAD-binding protein, partial [Salmonella enterica subsp. enterica serovar Heidelberg]|nr:FAD-binding protein [Salmonella enterica subsp. enterica serovar Heidelberg]